MVTTTRRERNGGGGRRKPSGRRLVVRWALAAFTTGVACALLVLDLGRGERRLEHPLQRLCAVDDAQLRRWPRGAQAAQMFSGPPSGGSESMHLMVLPAITAAGRSIDLGSSHFVPDELAVRALVEAMWRGARMRIVVPGPLIDAAVVRRASRALWGELFGADAPMHEYRPTMFHCKVSVVGGLFVSVGSTDFDDRSFRLDDEASLDVLDVAFARRQTERFEADLGQAERVALDAWRRRPWRDKLVEHAAAARGAAVGHVGPVLRAPPPAADASAPPRCVHCGGAVRSGRRAAPRGRFAR